MCKASPHRSSRSDMSNDICACSRLRMRARGAVLHDGENVILAQAGTIRERRSIHGDSAWYGQVAGFIMGYTMIVLWVILQVILRSTFFQITPRRFVCAVFPGRDCMKSHPNRAFCCRRPLGQSISSLANHHRLRWFCGPSCWARLLETTLTYVLAHMQVSVAVLLDNFITASSQVCA